MTKLELMNHKNKTIDVNIPPSVYFGGCAFGSAFCKLLATSLNYSKNKLYLFFTDSFRCRCI